MARVRIGIDVGGTFTDVVVIDNETHELIGQLKIPTTHAADQGVALGIVTALERVMEKFSLLPDDVSFIAHSTTQATNALLEGDVASVGIIGLGSGVESLLAKRATKVPPVELAPGKHLTAAHTFIRTDSNTTNGVTKTAIEKSIRDFAAQGVSVIVASQAFGVDETSLEESVAAQARQIGMRATSGHEVSSLYGLRVRTRTAVINAAILPRMIETAEMTERCVKSTGIGAPLMIMRSDGGVMNVTEVHSRPILTMLSGPAAGIAGALMHERVSDGIFIEVGGTSADISVIRDGSPVTRPARLNGHRMYLNTLDVRTMGVGGGSMVRVARAEKNVPLIVDVGPRSAHIAGLGYACFADPEELKDAEIELLKPARGDASDHAVLRTTGGKRFAITTTCAANFLGYVKPGHFASGNQESAKQAFVRLYEFGKGYCAGPEDAAIQLLKAGCRKVASAIEQLILEYQLERDQVVLVGGGGGAASLVPFTAEMMKLEHRIARNAEVISPIGVAMAMVRDTVERNMVDPTADDILRVRREAAEAAIAAGAVADSIEVQVEVDKRRNLVRATAMGTTEMRRRDGESQTLTAWQCRESAARSMRVEVNDVQPEAETSGLLIFTARQQTKSFGGLFRSQREMLRVLDRTGVVRLQRGKARVSICALSQINEELTKAVEALTDFGDAGRAIPDIFVLYGSRIANFSGLAELEQVIALTDVELRSLDPEAKLVVIACPGQL